ncbi:MAG: TIGR02266 family protein [Myxococcales bacterium]|nr:TIGR02266 family protein [Myxococcales bacterium]
MQEKDDRRREVRAPVELEFRYEQLNAFFADYAKNIGHGGIFVATASPLDLGTEFTFRLIVPHLDAPLLLRGRVQWRVTPETAHPDQEPGMGIGFLYESEAERLRVETIVDRLMEESLGPAIYAKLVRRTRRQPF